VRLMLPNRHTRHIGEWNRPRGREDGQSWLVVNSDVWVVCRMFWQGRSLLVKSLR
jgi:hypothetical protein